MLRLIPCHLSQLSNYLRSGLIGADVVFLQLSPPDSSGEYSYGTANDYMQAAMTHARVVITEVNDQSPWTWCDKFPQRDRIDYIVRVSRPPVMLEARPIGEVEQGIARHVCNYIEDGTTIQIGIGAIPDAMLAAVGDRRDLGFHSGLDQRSRGRSDGTRRDDQCAQAYRHRYSRYWRTARHPPLV